MTTNKESSSLSNYASSYTSFDPVVSLLPFGARDKVAPIDRKIFAPIEDIYYGIDILKKRFTFLEAFKIDISNTWNEKAENHQVLPFFRTVKKILLIFAKILASPIRTHIVKSRLNRPYLNLSRPYRFAKLITYFHEKGVDFKKLLASDKAEMEGELRSKAVEFQMLFERSKCDLLDLISELDTEKETPKALLSLCDAFFSHISTAQRNLSCRGRSQTLGKIKKQDLIDFETRDVVKLMYDEMIETIEIGRKASVRIRENLNRVSPRRPQAVAALKYQSESLKKLVEFFKRENSTICQELLEMLSERHPEFKLIQGDESLAAIKNMEEKFKNIWKSHSRAARAELLKLEKRLFDEELQAAKERIITYNNEKQDFLGLFQKELSFIHDANTLIGQESANDLRDEEYPLEEIETRFAKSWYGSFDLPDWLTDLKQNGISIEDQILFVINLEKELDEAFKASQTETLEKRLITARKAKLLLLKKLKKMKRRYSDVYKLLEDFIASANSRVDNSDSRVVHPSRVDYQRGSLEPAEIEYISSIQNLLMVKDECLSREAIDKEIQAKQDLTLSTQDLRSLLKIVIGDGSEENPGSPTITVALLKGLKKEDLDALDIEMLVCDNLDIELRIFDEKIQDFRTACIRSKPILIEENGQKRIVALRKFELNIATLRSHLSKEVYNENVCNNR